jgi:transposase InsO family protein
MEKNYGIKISRTTIYRVLNKRGKLRSKWKINKYGEAPKGKCERDVVQTDTVDFGDVYAYTYIDTYTRQAYVDLETGLEALDGYASLTGAKEVFKEVRLIQTDGGSEFEKEFKDNVKMFAKEHRVSRPYKKNEQSFIESFNRTLRKECLGWRKYKLKELPGMKEKVKQFLYFYNNERPHLGINMQIPNEVAVCRI